MTKLDRYITRQLIGPFAFFLLIFGGIIWLNQSLRIIDIVVENGQSGFVFLELSSLLLPRILSIAVPISAFAAAVFLTNRLYTESELIVMMGAGRGPAQLARPFLIFGVFSLILMSFVTNILFPATVTRQQDRMLEIRKEFIAQIIQEGEFISPAKGVFFFFGHTAASGDLQDILINDTSNPEVSITHTAHKGQILQSDDGPKLLLFDGVIQQYSRSERLLSTVNFDSLSYDLAPYSPEQKDRKTLISELSTRELLLATSTSNEHVSGSVSDALAEGHGRIVNALMALIVPVLGAGVLLTGGFRRSGFLLRIAMAVVVMVALNSLTGVTENWMQSSPELWPVLYLPPVLGAALTVFLYWLSTGRWRRIHALIWAKHRVAG